MAGRVSAEMLQAQALLQQGLTAYAAAKAVGIAQSSITRSAACQAIIAQRSINPNSPSS